MESTNQDLKMYSIDTHEEGELKGKLTEPFVLDHKSVIFLEKALHSRINPNITTSEEYRRTMFYFRCYSIQIETSSPSKTDALSLDDLNAEKTDVLSFADYISSKNKKDFSLAECAYSKEKADILFEDIYPHAEQRDKLIKEIMKRSEQGLSIDEYIEAINDTDGPDETAKFLIFNDKLYNRLFDKEYNTLEEAILHSDKCNGQIMSPTYLATLTRYAQAYPDLMQTLNDRYTKMTEAAFGKIAPYLPEGFKKEEYDAVCNAHPKAVLALAIAAEACQQEKGIKLKIDSPQDMLEKCQTQEVINMSDKLSFKDLRKSVENLSKQTTADKQLVETLVKGPVFTKGGNER